MILEVCWDDLRTLSFGLSQLHGHGSWLVCDMALLALFPRCCHISRNFMDGPGLRSDRLVSGRYPAPLPRPPAGIRFGTGWYPVGNRLRYRFYRLVSGGEPAPLPLLPADIQLGTGSAAASTGCEEIEHPRIPRDLVHRCVERNAITIFCRN
jgi:hypothetical protein